MTSKTHKMKYSIPSGVYFVGDPSKVLDEQFSDRIQNESAAHGIVEFYDDEDLYSGVYVFTQTKYDRLLDNDNHEYTTDSGYIGIIEEGLWRTKRTPSSGRVFHAEREINIIRTDEEFIIESGRKKITIELSPKWTETMPER